MASMNNITKKQAGVIYRAWKTGEITATKETINLVYDYADDVRWMTSDAITENLIDWLKACIGSIFRGDYETATSDLEHFKSYHERVYC